MVEKMLFYVISISLIVIIFIKKIRKNNIIYLSSLILQAIGIFINIIALILKLKLNLFFILLTYLMSIIFPFFIIICEKYKIDLLEKIYMILAKICLMRKDNKNAKKILISLIEKKDDCKETHKMLAEIYEQEGRN